MGKDPIGKQTRQIALDLAAAGIGAEKHRTFGQSDYVERGHRAVQAHAVPRGSFRTGARGLAAETAKAADAANAAASNAADVARTHTHSLMQALQRHANEA